MEETDKTQYAKPKKLSFFNLMADDAVFTAKSIGYNLTHIKRWKIFNLGEYFLWQKTKKNIRKRFHQLEKDHEITQEVSDYSVDDLIWIRPEFVSRVNKYYRLSEAYVKDGKSDKRLEMLISSEFFKIKSLIEFAKRSADANRGMVKDKYGITDINMEFSDAYKYELEKKTIYNDAHDHKLDPEFRHRSLMNKARLIVRDGLKFYQNIRYKYDMKISNDINNIDTLAGYLHNIHVKYSWPKVTLGIAAGVYALYLGIVGISYFQLNQTIREARTKIPAIELRISEQRQEIDKLRYKIMHSKNKQLIDQLQKRTNMISKQKIGELERQIADVYSGMSETNIANIRKARKLARWLPIFEPECYPGTNMPENTQQTQKIYK